MNEGRAIGVLLGGDPYHFGCSPTFEVWVPTARPSVTEDGSSIGASEDGDHDCAACGAPIVDPEAEDGE